MPTDAELARFAYENRERLIALAADRERIDAELYRLRERQHELAESVGVVQVLAEQVRNIAADVEQLAGDVRGATQQIADTVRRPTASVIAQYGALIVAAIALVAAFRRG